MSQRDGLDKWVSSSLASRACAFTEMLAVLEIREESL